MNSFNHFLFSAILLRLMNASTKEAMIFSIIFGVFPDLDYFFNKNFTKHRTFIQEPFGIILIGVPISIILSFIKKEYFMYTIISYASHIFLDYVTIHRVSPFSPFSKKEYKVGFIKGFPKPSWYNNEKGLSEIIITLILLIVILL